MGRNRKWTEEACREEALKYKTMMEFYIGSPTAYQISNRHGWKKSYTWLSSGEGRRPKGTWTEEKCKEEASKYKNISEFSRGAIGAFRAAEKNGWIETYGWLRKRYSKWDKESCERESRKYSSRNEFGKGCPSAYQASIRNGWISEFEWLGEGKTTKKWTEEKCREEASKYDSLTEFAKMSHHAYWVATRNGWTEGYVWKNGSVGKRRRWDRATCIEEGSKHSSRSDFFRKCPSGYNAALKYGLLDEIFGERETAGRKKENKGQ